MKKEINIGYLNKLCQFLPAKEFKVYFAIYIYYCVNGHYTFGKAYISRYFNIPMSTLKKVLKSLEEKGLLLVKREKKNGQNFENEYTPVEDMELAQTLLENDIKDNNSGFELNPLNELVNTEYITNHQNITHVGSNINKGVGQDYNMVGQECNMVGQECNMVGQECNMVGQKCNDITSNLTDYNSPDEHMTYSSNGSINDTFDAQLYNNLSNIYNNNIYTGVTYTGVTSTGEKRKKESNKEKRKKDEPTDGLTYQTFRNHFRIFFEIFKEKETLYNVRMFERLVNQSLDIWSLLSTVERKDIDECLNDAYDITCNRIVEYMANFNEGSGDLNELDEIHQRMKYRTTDNFNERVERFLSYHHGRSEVRVKTNSDTKIKTNETSNSEEVKNEDVKTETGGDAIDAESKQE